VEENPFNPQIRLSLAASYLAVGNRIQSILEIEKIIELDPDFKDQGEFFIREIRAGRNP